jgi:hypothetical protein
MTWKKLAEIETIITDLERLDRESKGQYRQAEDREAHDIVARIERRMKAKLRNEKNAPDQST